MAPPKNTKPLVSAALICHDIILEEGGIATLVKVGEVYQVQVVGAPAGVIPAIQLTAFFGIKSGDVRGKSELSLRLRRPDGSEQEMPNRWPVVLNGEDHGANLRVQLGLPVIYGLYWLDLYWNGEYLTSAPFRLTQAAPGAG